MIRETLVLRAGQSRFCFSFDLIELLTQSSNRSPLFSGTCAIWEPNKSADPRRIPVTKPPMLEKLSTNGRTPSTRLITKTISSDAKAANWSLYQNRVSICMVLNQIYVNDLKEKKKG